MAASKNRIDWALLLLRLGVGGLAILQGIDPIRHAKGAMTVGNALHLGRALAEILCGSLVILGVWMVPAAIGILALIGWPLVHGWLHGSSVLGEPHGLFRFLATLASCLGGAGKWSVGKG